MKRICPSEKILAEYITGLLAPGDAANAEEHLAACPGCRRLIAETHDITKRSIMKRSKNMTLRWFAGNRWVIASSVMFLFSFIFSRYFLQFLAAALVMGAKWIIDSRTTKMLVMIHEAWKRGDRNGTDRIFRDFQTTERR